jgi:hypothetical protein
MGLSEFPDTLLPVILHFGGAIGDQSSSAMIRRPVSFTSPFAKHLYLHSRQGLVMLDLLNNFLNLLKLFSGCGEQFHEIATTVNGGGKERKINGGAATAHQVRDGRKELKQKYLQKDSAFVLLCTPPPRRA